MNSRQTGAKLLLVALAGSFLLAFAPPGQAGTSEAPEITDPANDQVILGTAPACVTTTCAAAERVDVHRVWIDEETATTFKVNIATKTAPAGATAATARYDFHASYGTGPDVVSTVVAKGGATISPPAGTANVQAVEVSGTTLIMTIAKEIYGAPTVGSELTKIYVSTISSIPEPAPANSFVTDRAPNTGYGTNYVFICCDEEIAGLLDDDQDGLNDTWEIQYFGDIEMENGTGDPDGDGLNNTAEQELGTDPTNADTDGDDVSDGNDEAPLDPNVPALTNTTDRDNDTLPDVWERKYFNNTSAQNATGDPDGDGLNNSAEFLLGTDPTKADSDGDGVDDGLDTFPLDATKTGAEKPVDSKRYAKPELYAGAGMFATAGTLCLLGLARFL